MRFVEIALFALPFVIFLVWRLLLPGAGPSRQLVISFGVGVVAVAIMLLWFRNEETAPPGALYVPARQEDGRIIPGHMVPQANP